MSWLQRSQTAELREIQVLGFSHGPALHELWHSPQLWTWAISHRNSDQSSPISDQPSPRGILSTSFAVMKLHLKTRVFLQPLMCDAISPLVWILAILPEMFPHASRTLKAEWKKKPVHTASLQKIVFWTLRGGSKVSKPPKYLWSIWLARILVLLSPPYCAAGT